MYVSGKDAAISGDTRSVVKRPTSSLAAGGVAFAVLVLELRAGAGECISMEGAVSLVRIGDMVGIVF